MTREEAKAFLVSVGVAEPTEQNVTDFLNTHNKEVQKERDLATQYKAKALESEKLKAELDALNDAKLTDEERAKKELEAQAEKVATLEKTLALMQRKNALAEKGITGEDADKLFKEDGSLDIDAFGTILAEREKKAKEQAEKELLERTPDPKGGDPSNGDKPDALLTSVIGALTSSNKASAEIINQYR